MAVSDPVVPTTQPNPGRLAALLGRLYDPEWLPCLGFLLLPALLAAAVGSLQRASFFLGIAVYLATLKWLGWAGFGRFARLGPAHLLFPAEVFAGLAVASCWFYLRSLLGQLRPGSYGLGELAVLPY